MQKEVGKMPIVGGNNVKQRRNERWQKRLLHQWWGGPMRVRALSSKLKKSGFNLGWKQDAQA